MTYSDVSYAIFHTHDVIAGSRAVKGLEPHPGSTTQENEFFN